MTIEPPPPTANAPQAAGARDAGVRPGGDSGKARRALPWIVSTNFCEGLPWSFIHQMATEFLTAIRASNTQIAATSWFHLAVTLKFLWSPAVDLFGRKRTWVVALQALLGVGMLGIGLVSETRNLRIFWFALSALAIVHATHDVACDGFYLQALDRHGQALFSGARTAAFRAAMFVGSLGLVYLAGQTSWFWGFGAAGLLMLAMAVLNGALMPHPAERPAEPAGAREAPGAIGFWSAYGTFFGQPQATLVLSFMLVYKLGDIMMFAMSKPLLRDIGIDLSHRALLNGIGTATFIVASIAGGAIIGRFDLRRCLIPMTFAQNLAIPLYVAIAVIKPSFGAVIPFIIAEQFAAGIGAAAHVVFLMQRCRAAFSASHYAFATAIVSLASTFSGAISGPLNERLGHPLFFAVAFAASWPSLILVFLVPRTPLEPSEKAAPVASDLD